MSQSVGKSYIARIVYASLFLGTIAWSGTAWAIVNTDQDIPVTANGHEVPSGEVTITETATGKVISKSKITQGKTHLTIHEKTLTEKTKVTVTVVNGDTHETTKEHGDLGPILSGGIAAVTPAAATQTSSLRTAIQTADSGGIWIAAGGGVSQTFTDESGNFFGPGTGGGDVLGNNSSSPSLMFTAGAFLPFGPSWYGGVVVNVIAPPVTATNFGSTPTGIQTSSLIEQRGPAFDLMGRVGLFAFPTIITGVEMGFFGEVGVHVERDRGEIAAGGFDDFIASKTIPSLVAGGGFDVPLCQPAFGVTTPFAGLGIACPELVVEVTHTFANANWLLGITPGSGGEVTVAGATRVSVEAVFPFGANADQLGPYHRVVAGYYNNPPPAPPDFENPPFFAAPAAASDIRLKRDITQLAVLDNGIKLYSFRYFGSDQVYVGVMAQQVAAIAPQAVVMEPNGYLAVYYDRLGLKMQTLEEWQATRRAVPLDIASP